MLDMLRNECEKMLTEKLIPFWSALEDRENGGFYGFMDHDLNVDKQADKGVILHSRILWFFSGCYKALGGSELRRLAGHAYEFVKNKCIDYERGGVYWMLDFQGNPSDCMKHTYNCAFAVYALSAYYNAVGDREALELAYRIFSDIEANAPDEYGYREAFSRDWEPVPNDALSENGLQADKTMNAMLHLIEAYTELYKADRDERVALRLRFLLDLMSDAVYDKETKALKVFFNEKLETVGDIHSYGHDIEASWLMDLACETLGDRELISRINAMDLSIAENIEKLAFHGGALYNERDGKSVDKKRVWWVQAEAVVGYCNAYAHSGDGHFLRIAETVFGYIRDTLTDERCGEWFSEVSFEGVPDIRKEMVGPWKCPYHNGRMCLEIMRRAATN